MPDVNGSLSVLSPVRGTALSLETVPDPVFSQGMVGPGVAVHPEPGQEGGQEGTQDAVAPMDGILAKLHPHAFVVLADDGRRGVLVHLGIDTVKLKGEGFTLLAREGDRVTAGTPVVRWSPGTVAAGGLPAVVPVVALEAAPADLGDIAEGGVDGGSVLFTWT
ncbi:PTS system, glucose-specific IIA component/PTS system, N-acetylglucosamine-specific IIA component [Nocardiopsis flavescens]|uniref:PTS system, glucose-specific IIA component/PTS system, N-acetylglucosamine-specific IIA component n=1 Tax=Nocardiopsis flavescens TaxID=758803 RepID=A0A1M6WK39_9ACTN|nr:PTS glucose transporter subunit IIA [Nocardiopsis flavescens]SHK93959.1 PTS system, glucose-specific IIA component/PTS system, N-acetylglucosamine-specific IIA component [Nocardiopsis flavescens]